jgi:anti-anti-sigma regulatory factor
MPVKVAVLDDDVVTIHVDEVGGAELAEAVVEQCGAGYRRFLIDFDGVDYFNSMNIAGVITARNQILEVDGRIELANLSSPLRAIFGVLKLERVFDLGRDRDSALAALRH